MCDNYNEYKIGDTIHGREIESIICQNENAIVYFYNDHKLAYDYSKTQVDIKEVTNIFNELLAKIPFDAPEDNINIGKRLLGASLFNALNANNKDEIKKAFKKAKRVIKNVHNSYQAKLFFIGSGIIYTLLVTIFYLFRFYPKDFSDNFLLCGMLGTVGALFFVLQRNPNIKICLFSPKRLIFLESLIKCVTGFVSGLLLYVIVRSNLILGLVQGNEYALFTFSIISGFSERFIPELFSQVQDYK